MTTLIKAMNKDKNRVATNIKEYNIISKLILQRIITPKLFHVKIFKLKEKNWFP